MLNILNKLHASFVYFNLSNIFRARHLMNDLQTLMPHSKSGKLSDIINTVIKHATYK